MWRVQQDSRLRLDADIVPNQGLGGLRLRVSLAEIQELVPTWEPPGERSYELVRPFEARYKLANGVIEIGVDVRNGKIFKLIANRGYDGILFGKIRVGMP